jgi:hypothetical protein
MSTPNANVRGAASEKGYALLLVVFLCAIMLVAVMAAAPNVLTEGRREREREMIWRGGQYVRAISLYRRKTGKFPPSIEDLAKGQPGLHFLRKQYKDPFNTEDGSWRLIYVGPAGQLIGSFTQTWSANQLTRTPPAAATTPAPVAPAGTASSAQPASTAPPSTGPSTGDPNSQNQADAGAGAPSAATASVPDASAINSSPVFGGSVVGVASKIDHSSVIRFRKAKNYRLFEFIWDPMKELNAGPATTGPAPGRPGDPLSPSPQPDPILNPKP